MSFTQRRGRPKSTTTEIDYGTPELRSKRQRGITVEPLDWLRQQELITPQLHWCGMHFRWLYTLRYGTTTAKSCDLSAQKGILNIREYDEWREEREQEFKQALLLLNQEALLDTALEYCVYQQRRPRQWQWRNHPTIQSTITALGQLERLWCKRISF